MSNTVTTPHYVKVYHNARWHSIERNAVTSLVLQRLYHEDFKYYMNPTEAEWTQLRQYRKDQNALQNQV